MTGAILAGGRARRMGGQDKGLIEINGRPMIEYILDAVRPQVGPIFINANRSRDRYARYGYPVISDRLADYQGPLAGIASVLDQSTTPLVLTVPCDSPLLPSELAARLYAALMRDKAELSVAFDGERMQPVFSLLRRELLASLLAFLHEGERKIDLWYARHAVALADFEDAPDTFLNINTPEERLRLAERLVEAT